MNLNSMPLIQINFTSNPELIKQFLLSNGYRYFSYIKSYQLQIEQKVVDICNNISLAGPKVISLFHKHRVRPTYLIRLFILFDLYFDIKIPYNFKWTVPNS
jgi:hypothetical protein